MAVLLVAGGGCRRERSDDGAAPVTRTVPPDVPSVLDLLARRETPPARDDADDPAIWTHPSDPVRSVVIGTDKDAGLHVYDLEGRELQFVSGIKPNNVDVRGDIVVAADDSPGSLLVYRIDRETRRLRRLAEFPTKVDAHGLCLYRSPAGPLFAFANDLRGRVEQWELTETDDAVDGRPVRSWDHGGAVEGCVVDDEAGVLYLGEEERGVWRYGAGPRDPVADPKLVDRTGEGRLEADVEGLAILRAPGGRGLLLVSSQGDDHFAAYRRDGTNEVVARFRVSGGDVDGCEDTDGIELTTAPLGPGFPRGLFVCQDGRDGGSKDQTNFKLVPLDGLVTLDDGR